MRSLLVSLAVLLWASLATAAEPVIQSSKNGNWSEPTTWQGGKVPAGGDRVLIRSGHRVVFDGTSNGVIRGISISGSLVFATNATTKLDVGLIKVQAGDEYSEEGFDCDGHLDPPKPGLPKPRLEVGTQEAPIDSDKTATIRLHYIEGMNKDSCPAIVCCGGHMEFHGKRMTRSWAKLGTSTKVGDTAVTLAEPVAGWAIGDRLIVTGTQLHGDKKTESVTEERTIKAFDGDKFILDRALEMPHLGDGNFRAEVANLSRNLIVESAQPEGNRGHTMYHRGSSGSIRFAEFRHLGKKNVLGRYAMHFHLAKDTMRGSAVEGNSIWDSHNRWVTVHGTDYLIVRDNVGYQSVGHGFFLEDGTEVYNVFDRNLAVGAERGKRLPKQVLSFDANDGAGFWWANSLNTFTRNIAAECDQYGFRFEATPSSSKKLVMAIRQPDGTKKDVDIRTLPFVKFEDNEVHTSVGLYGVNLGEGVNRVGPDAQHPFVVKNMKIWDVHYGFRPQVPNLHVENLTIHKVAYGVYHPNFDNHYYKNVSIAYTNTEPFNRGHDDLSVQHGILAVDGLTFDGIRSGGMPLIQISDDNPTGNAVSHFRNVKVTNWIDTSKSKAIANLGGGPRPQPKSEKGVPIYIHDWFGSGKHAEVASVKSAEYKADTKAFQSVKDLTGDESRAREVSNIAFPIAPKAIDDLPPTTVITRVSISKDGQVSIRGTSADNGKVTKVTVNGKPVKPMASNFADWEIVIEKPAKAELVLEAKAEDDAGNVEKTPAMVVVP